MTKSSVEGPKGLLRLDLSLQCASQPDDQELTESDAYSNTSHCVEVVVDQTLKPDRIINTGGWEIEWSHLNSLDTPPGVDPLQNFSLLFDIVSTFLVSLGGSHLEATHEVEGDNTVLLDMTAGVWDSTPRLWKMSCRVSRGWNLPLYARIILDIISAVEILIIIPVFIAERAETTALEVLLDEVDDILDCKRWEASLSLCTSVSTHLEIKVVSIALNQFLRQFLLQELSQFVGINEGQRNQ